MMSTQWVQRLTQVEQRVIPRQVVVPDAVQLLAAAGITPDPWQRRVLESTAPRLLLNCCRQSGKTQVAAALALHTALTHPGSLSLILSPSLRQSQESFRRVADLAQANAQAVSLDALSALRLELTNRSRVLSLPATEGTIRGYSKVKLLLVDEASRVIDPLFYAVRPMQAVGTGNRIIALSTPFGRRGWWHQAWTAEADWEKVQVRAEQCPRISPQFLADEKRTLPALWYASEYMCEFTDTITTVFREEDIVEAIAQDVAPWFPKGV